MGTNFYVRTNTCQHCGRFDEQHIGKSSAGFPFLFNPFKTSFKEWIEYLKEKEIYNEWEQKTELADFVNMVNEQQKCQEHYICNDVADNFRYLDAEGYRINRYDAFC